MGGEGRMKYTALETSNKINVVSGDSIRKTHRTISHTILRQNDHDSYLLHGRHSPFPPPPPSPPPPPPSRRPFTSSSVSPSLNFSPLYPLPPYLILFYFILFFYKIIRSRSLTWPARRTRSHERWIPRKLSVEDDGTPSR